MSSPPAEAPSARPHPAGPGWRQRGVVAAICAVAVLSSGMCGTSPHSEPERDVGAQAGPSAVSARPVARITIETAATEPPARVEIELFHIQPTADGGEERSSVARHEGPLPVTLSAPRGAPLLVVVSAPGRARHAERLELEDDRTVRAPLGPGEIVRGRVVDERGSAVAGAELQLVREGGPAEPWSARSEGDGGFMVDTLMEGEYRVVATARGHARAARDGVRPGTAVSITLERVGLVSGRVVRPDGTGAPGASVVIAGSGLWPARRATSGDDGRFRLGDVPPGIYEVRAFAGDQVAQPRRGLQIEAGQPVFLTFALADGVALRGVVRDSSRGVPVAHAELTVSADGLDAAPRAAATGPDGRFTVAGLQPGLVRVNVFAEGYVPVSQEWDATQPLDVDLEPAATLEGVVLDEQRRPVAGATIEVLGESTERQPVALGPSAGFRSSVFAQQLRPAEIGDGTPGPLEVVPGPVPPIPTGPGPESPLSVVPPSATEVRMAASFSSDDQGRFRVTGVPPGHVQVVARRAGRAPASTPRIYVGAGTVRDDVELVLLPAGQLRGTVRDGRGAGVEGVLVDVRSDREPHPRAAVTDANGEFVLGDVVGELAVTALPRGRPPARVAVTVAPGASVTVDVPLGGELHTLRGRVLDPEGFPVAGSQLVLVSLRADAPFRRTFYAERDGTFSLSDLPPAPWRVEGSSPGFATTRLDLFGATEEAQVVLQRGAEVRGTVLDDYERVGVAARVVITRDALPPEVLETQTDAEGGFRFAPVRPGRWQLRVESPSHVSAARTLEVEARRAPRDITLDPVRLTPAGWLEGTVIDALGAPVARARVWADGAEAVARTDAQGQFALRGVPPGIVVARASHPAAGEGQTADVRVLVGRETPGLVVRLPERFDPDRAASLPGQRQGVAVMVGAAQGEIRVRHVVVGSRAERAGLRAGDVIEAIDGVQPETTGEAARALRGASSVPAVLTVQRGEERAILLVERERWTPP